MKKRKFLTTAFALIMALMLVPSAVQAEDGGSETSSSGVELTKTATLEADGTYTIQLEAYATGEVTTTTTTKETGVPCDIVLVLDQSSSMAYDFEGNKSNISTENQRITALKAAATKFVNAVQENANKFSVDHKVAVVGFAYGDGSSNKYVNTELLSTESEVNYNSATETYYKDALVSANVEGALNTRLSTAIDRVSANGATYSNYGLEMAKNILDNRTDTTYINVNGETVKRKTIVVFFTDGYPGYYASTDGFYDKYKITGYQDTYDYNNITTANATIEQASELKKNGATIYSVGIFTDADPAYGYNFVVNNDNTYGTYYTDGKKAANAFMHFVSSDYDNTCTSMISSDRSTVVNNGYYLAASNADDLTNVFETISSNIDTSTSSTTSTLDADSILRDVLSEGFDATNASVTVQTASYIGNGAWEDSVTDESITYTNKKGVIDVKGFSYKDNYVVDGSGSVQTSGKKLMVTIKGVVPTDDAVTGEQVNTNAVTSGIYADENATSPAAVFPQPKTILTKKTYVLDFAKPVTLQASDWAQDTVSALTSADGEGRINKAASVSPKYGKVTVNSDNNSLAYQPITTNWDGYDSFYAFGNTTDATVTSASANENGNLWSKVTVMPATSVYYEDDFGYEPDAVEASEGYTTIVYSTKDNESEWTTVYTDNKESSTAAEQSSANIVYGTDDAYAGNLSYSADSAHTAKGGAKATFTFTGTGLDIYTRTTAASGQVYVKIVGNTPDAEGNVKTYSALIDDEFVSTENGLYQIPTVTFQNIERDTYTATLTVLADGDGNSTYYLDAIRVYNPLDETVDSTVKDAYTDAGENDAVYKEVRDILIVRNSLSLNSEGTVQLPEEGQEGVVYIDKLADSESKTGTLTSSIGEYEDYGPKNEVYLAKGEAIAFQITGGYENVFVGLKSPEGTATSVKMTNGLGTTDNIQINSATDMYYRVTPTSDGMVVIQNTGEKLLSITKLRLTGVTTSESTSESEGTSGDDSGTNAVVLRSTNALMSYAASFTSLEVVEDAGAGDVVIEDSEGQGTDTPSDDKADDGDMEGAGGEGEAGDNPDEPEAGDNADEPEAGDNADEPEDEGNSGTSKVETLWNAIWNSFKSWFQRR